jgi:hypothetical protein
MSKHTPEISELKKQNHDYEIAQKGNLARLDELNDTVARVWKALGITTYTGHHIADHVTGCVLRIKELEAELHETKELHRMYKNVALEDRLAQAETFLAHMDFAYKELEYQLETLRQSSPVSVDINSLHGTFHFIDGVPYVQSMEKVKDGDTLHCVWAGQISALPLVEQKTKYGDKGIVDTHYDRVKFENGEEYVYWVNRFIKLVPAALSKSSPPKQNEKWNGSV